MEKIRALMSLGLLIGCAVTGLSPTAQATEVIFSDLGPPGNLYNATSGYDTGCCSLPNFSSFPLAAGFFSPGNFQVTQIDMTLHDVGYPGNLNDVPELLVYLYADTGGHPASTPLLSAVVIGATNLDPKCCPLETIPVSGVSLQSGGLYWLVARPESDTVDFWNYNNTGAMGPILRAADDHGDQGPQLFWPNPSQTGLMPAFDVLGTPIAAPEPSALLLLGTGLLGVVGAARRKWLG